MAIGLCALLTGAAAGDSVSLAEASGVTRRGDTLLVVDDGHPGVYFRIPLNGRTGPTIPLGGAEVQRVSIQSSPFVSDLESIEVLNDGRVVVLSERLRMLLCSTGVVAMYGAPFSEFGKRGLEGVAVRAGPRRSSLVAVLWEGGYPEYVHLPAALQRSAGRTALKPLVLVHTVESDRKGILVPTDDAFQLDVPLPPGEEPRAQRFRAPDLVWHRAPDREWEFIVLLSSANSAGNRKYEHHWLQRFSTEGERLGAPLDLDKIAPPNMRGTNWEGLGWFEAGKSLVIVNESHPRPSGVAYVVDLPPAWRRDAEKPPIFTHRTRRKTGYFIGTPTGGRPDGTLADGTAVAMIEFGPRYCLVRTKADLVAYVRRKSLRPNSSD